MIEVSWKKLQTIFCTLLLTRARWRKKNVALHNQCLLRRQRSKRQKNPKMSVKRHSNWEWNRFFRKSNCCIFYLQRAAADLYCQIFSASCCETQDRQFGQEFSDFKCQICQKLNFCCFTRRISKVLSCLQFFFVCAFAPEQFHCFSSLIWCW